MSLSPEEIRKRLWEKIKKNPELRRHFIFLEDEADEGNEIIKESPEHQETLDKRKQNKSNLPVCVKRLFGLCSRECINPPCEELPCYKPATVLDKLILYYLEQQKDYVPDYVLKKAKYLWVQKYREEYRPFDVAQKLILEAAKIIEKEKSRRSNPSPCEWIIFL